MCVDENCSQGERARARLHATLATVVPTTGERVGVLHLHAAAPASRQHHAHRQRCFGETACTTVVQVDVQRSSVMHVDRAVVYTNASIMFNELAEHGTLLVCLHVRVCLHAGCSRP